MKLGTNEVSDKVFGVEYKPALIHQIVTACQANSRSDTKAQKSRSDVNASGIKPYRQKGTGRARAGSRASPIWRKGGVTFGSSRADHSQKMNRKMYQNAMCSILSELVRQDRLKVVKSIDIKEPKTKSVKEYLTKQEISKNTLIISGEDNITLFLASRNLVDIACIFVSEINPLNLLAYQNILIEEDSLLRINKQFA